jgi:two-component system nitrate/nitrite response regulator NarL
MSMDPSALDHVAEGTPARIFVLSDVRLYREGLISCLSQRLRRSIVMGGDSSEAGLGTVVQFAPDVLVLDAAVSLALETVRSVRSRCPAVTVVAYGVEEAESKVIACAEAGIAGYVTRDASEQDLLAAIAHAVRGELHCSPQVAGLLFRTVGLLASAHAPRADSHDLTLRERQVLGLVKNGLSNKEIARTLHIGTATVKNHVHNILEKMNVERRSQAAARMRPSAEQ